MRRRLGTLLVGVALVGATAALLPTAAHAACTTPELPVAGCPLPAADPTPTPTPGPAGTPAATAPTTLGASAPAQTAAPPVPVTAPATPAAVLPPAAAAVAVLATPAQAPVVPGPVVLAPPASALPAQPVQLLSATRPQAGVPLSGVVASSFALVSFSLLALALLLAFLAGLRPATPAPGGTVTTHRTRLWTGLGVLALAAVVGGVGWYRLSGEPLLNRQIPFLASAGVLVVLLSVLGGSLIIAEQLRGDQHRIGELEDAVR
ncbi:MAG: hypothetical protein ACXVFV_05310, partial [Mycobacteriales bacterium]